MNSVTRLPDVAASSGPASSPSVDVVVAAASLRRMHLFWIASRTRRGEPTSIPADRLPAAQSGTAGLEQPENRLSRRG
jgi:hypothetical protein